MSLKRFYWKSSVRYSEDLIIVRCHIAYKTCRQILKLASSSKKGESDLSVSIFIFKNY